MQSVDEEAGVASSQNIDSMVLETENEATGVGNTHINLHSNPL